MQNTVEFSSSACEGILSGKTIILGVSGGIAAYKAAYVASALVQRGADVHVVMTEHATEMIGPATFWAITGNKVLTDMFEQPEEPEIAHVSLTEKADLLLVAPATANVVGKLANGIADDWLTTMALAVKCPIVLAPAMNPRMYSNAIVIANIDRLINYEFIIIEPEEGRVACGEYGVGRLADPEKIIQKVEEVLIGSPRDYSGVNVLVTAGPTQEPIDPVRYISNRSSGKMGYAIAEVAAERGANVVLVSGPTELERPKGVEVVNVTTVHEMFDVVVDKAKYADVVISAAAPADFIPAKPADQKVKKSEKWTLELDQAEDILAELGKHKVDTVLVGFAAETENLEQYAQKKLEKKNLDLIIANDVSPESDTFGSDTNQVTLISRTGEKIEWPRMSKREVANSILDFVKINFLEGNK